jgi:hypothetical protein
MLIIWSHTVRAMRPFETDMSLIHCRDTAMCVKVLPTRPAAAVIIAWGSQTPTCLTAILHTAAVASIVTVDLDQML